MTDTYVPPPPGSRWMGGSKPKEGRKTFGRLLNVFGEKRKTLVVICLFGLFSSLLSIIGPGYLSDMADSVSDSISAGIDVDMVYIGYLAALLTVIYAASAVLKYLCSRMSWVTEEIIGDELRVQLSEKVSRISVGTMDGLRSGDIMSRFVNDTDTIRLRSTDCIVDTFNDIVMLVGTTIMMFLTEWKLALFAFLPTLVGFLIIRIIMKLAQKYFRAQSRNLGRMNVLVEETFRGLGVVRAYNGMDNVKKNFGEVNRSLLTTAFRSRVMGAIMPEMTGFINNLTYVLVCVVGSVLVLEGETTIGTIVAFIVYVKLMNQPLMGLSRSLSGLQEVMAASERVFEFLDMPEMDPEEEAHPAPSNVKGRVEFENVHFSYVPGREVLHGLDLTVEAGQKIAIVGPTGAGKTTMANLLLRFYDPDSGRITIDGIDTKEIRRDDVRDMFGVVLQDSWLFKGTLRQNLVFGNNDVPDSRIFEICEAIGLTQFIDTLKDGIDTFIEDPSRLSNGQKQQITIARAMLKDAPLLILDEATSSVDTRTERHIQQAMDRMMEGRTSFIIAHRLSTILSADKILVIRNGNILESGTHRELLARNGFYRNLYDSQFEFCD